MAAFQENHKRICPILENPTPDNPIPDYPTSENPMQLNKDILNTDLLNKEKNKLRSKHRKRVPFSVNLPARITCRTDLLVGKYPKPS